MILSGNDLQEFAAKYVEGMKSHAEQVQPASIDVRLAGKFLVSGKNAKVSFGDDGKIEYHGFKEVELEDGEVIRISRGKLVIASTIERFNMPPNIAGQFLMRSSAGRRGLDHLHAGYLDPGWHGHITLELTAVVPTEFKVGERIGQVVLFRTTGYSPYRGQYNGQVGPTLPRNAVLVASA